MKRWIIVLLAAAMLTGCITTREVVYREPYATDGYSGRDPYYDQDGYYSDAPTYYRDGSGYYSPSYGNRGDYYFGASSYGYGSFGVSYFDYPFYYSVFWPINRWYYDPFVYPGYYYGVTWFPRSYFSLGYSYGWNSHGWLSYSPYRYSYVDNYYDWRRPYHHYPNYRNYYPTPRYGDARVEASRLADIRRPYPSNAYPRSGSSSGYNRNQGGPAAPSYSGNRAAIPRGSYGATRPGAYGKTAPAADVRRTGAGARRSEPSTGLFGNPVHGSQSIPRSRLDGTRSLNDSRRDTLRDSDRNLPSRTFAPAERGTSIRGSVDGSNRPALPIRGTTPAPVRGTTPMPVRGMNPVPARDATTAPVRSAPSQGIPIRTERPVQRTAPVTTPSRDDSYGRTYQRDSAPAPRTAPSRDVTPMPARTAPPRSSVPQAPIRTMDSGVGRSGYAPARPVEAPVRSAPSRANPPTYSAPPPAPASRSEPTKSHSGNRDSGVRRVGSNRED